MVSRHGEKKVGSLHSQVKCPDTEQTKLILRLTFYIARQAVQHYEDCHFLESWEKSGKLVSHEKVLTKPENFKVMLHCQFSSTTTNQNKSNFVQISLKGNFRCVFLYDTSWD